jgi:endonuclease/exonuclease/phosphatase family metal-dependent hydrolase
MITVDTLNINYYVDKHGSWDLRKDLICQALERTNADIIALQAVRAEPGIAGGKNQAAQLSRMLSVYPQVYFGPAEHFPDGSMHGSAILSRRPVAVRDSLPLKRQPGLEDNNQRAILYARFNLPGGPLHLFNGHFSWVREQTQENLDQALPFIGAVQGPALLVGDLNIPSDSDLLDRLREAGWTDAWEKLHPGQDGFTFEADHPYMRIDYAWANASLAPKLHDIEIIRHDTGLARLSDHLGLKIDLDL